MTDREQYRKPPRDVDAWLAKFRQDWAAFAAALERYLDRVESINPNKNANKDN